jgi:effector-binding domain-containing protein
MTYEITIETREQQPAAIVSGRVAHDGIPEFLGSAFGEVMAAIGGEAGVAGPPFARYDMDGHGFAIDAGFPVVHPVEAVGRVKPSRLPGGTVATTMHVGSYMGLGAAYSALEQWIDANGMTAAGRPWEAYLDGPEVAEPRTLVCWPVTDA